MHTTPSNLKLLASWILNIGIAETVLSQPHMALTNIVYHIIYNRSIIFLLSAIIALFIFDFAAVSAQGENAKDSRGNNACRKMQIIRIAAESADAKSRAYERRDQKTGRSARYRKIENTADGDRYAYRRRRR